MVRLPLFQMVTTSRFSLQTKPIFQPLLLSGLNYLICKTMCTQGYRPRPQLYNPVAYEGHFRSNITMPVTSLCMIQSSKTMPQFVRLYITYKMVKSETKMHVEFEDSRLYIR